MVKAEKIIQKIQHQYRDFQQLVTKWQRNLDKQERTKKLRPRVELKSERVKTNISDLQTWRNEATKLGRSYNHLKKIDSVIKTATPKGTQLLISLRDFKAMAIDRRDYQLQQQISNRR
ncbi:MAG: hypothetical protein QNJ54_25345 [Prochloraceae cyanobacterium]|nr:hypothetical protein [Prochloraceae cyanobacterium]